MILMGERWTTKAGSAVRLRSCPSPHVSPVLLGNSKQPQIGRRATSVRSDSTAAREAASVLLALWACMARTPARLNRTDITVSNARLDSTKTVRGTPDARPVLRAGSVKEARQVTSVPASACAAHGVRPAAPSALCAPKANLAARP